MKQAVRSGNLGVDMFEDEQEGYELFRRAIVERDSDAWNAIYTRYRPLLVAWVRRCDCYAHSNEPAEDIADQAFTRAWAALTPERFAEFPSLARLLGYLRACIGTTVIDDVRAQATRGRVARQLHISAVATPEQLILAALDRDVLWHMVLNLAVTRAERITLVESFAYGYPPRTIHERHPQLFPDVTDVYAVKRNLFARLQRNRELIRLRESFVGVNLC
jgi:DNA-directed RNA polymerase specialized sigma24 family protein